MMLTWIASYIMLPKQYNPQIILPAFEISVQAPNLSNTEVSRFVVSPMENKIMELEWIDKVYGTAWDWYAGLMVQFKVWVDSEKAKIRLIQKLNENMDLKPLWVLDPVIKTIDPDELSQITFAISLKELNKNSEQNYIYLRQISNIIKEKLKTVENVTSLEVVWWVNKDIVITLDNEKLKSRNISSLEVFDKLKNNNVFSKLWNLNSDWGENILIEIDSRENTLTDLNKFIVYSSWDNIVYLEDVANIKYGNKRLDKISTYNGKEAVLLWVWKKIWSNSINVTTDVLAKLEEIKQELPKDIEITVIQNEWQTAKNATNMLMTNLFQSIVIVFVVLSLSLWVKNALNTAISIPLTLFSVFTFALLFWENINRITLFALILVLWMLVDDSTVVVENVNRHLENREKNNKSKLDAILDAIKEVELWVILSTVTRLLAFWAMFAVWDMMWEYMWPIPKFALMASIISTFLALTINPWISYYTVKNINPKNTEKLKQEKKKNSILNPFSYLREKGYIKKISIRVIYVHILEKFLWEEKREKRNRKIFKTVFWITLFVVIIWPIYAWVFKARMLPKSNQNQIYVWIDAPRWQTVEKMQDIWNDLYSFFKWQTEIKQANSTIKTDELNQNNIVKDVSYTIWQEYVWDFWNMFRWWSTRIWENQLSARINLYSPEVYKQMTGQDRVSSEKYVIQTRDYLKKYLLEKYPDLKIMLLEDPPGPPVKSTFQAKIKSESSDENNDIFLSKAQSLIEKYWTQLDLVDIYNSKSTTYRKTIFDIDNIALSKVWLTTEQVKNAILIANYWVELNIINDENILEVSNVILTSENDDLSKLKNITLKTPTWSMISLDSVLTEKYSFVWNDINSDKREKVDYIYGEMWNNSLIYPVIKLFWVLMSDEFLWDDYRVTDWNLYEINYIWLKDAKNYKIEWGWEWEVTMDTFRDLWIAMWISLLLIYLLLVWQFSSFGIAWIIMITFLLGFMWVFPWFSILYLLKWEYFSATSMIWIIALWWIVVWNAIILLEYINILKNNWVLLKDALLKAWYTRFKPIILTSLTTVLWAMTIIWDPVWSWLAWSIISWLLVSSILTLIVIPVFYYDSQKSDWEKIQ